MLICFMLACVYMESTTIIGHELQPKVHLGHLVHPTGCVLLKLKLIRLLVRMLVGSVSPSAVWYTGWLSKYELVARLNSAII